LSSTHDNLSGAIGDLQTVSQMIEARESQLSQGLSTLGSGLAGYEEISSYGQWFQIQIVYSCLANEAQGVCNYYEGSNPPSGTGPSGSPPSSALPSGSSDSSPLAAFGAGDTSAGSNASVGDVLRMMSGQGSFKGSTP